MTLKHLFILFGTYVVIALSPANADMSLPNAPKFLDKVSFIGQTYEDILEETGPAYFNKGSCIVPLRRGDKVTGEVLGDQLAYKHESPAFDAYRYICLVNGMAVMERVIVVRVEGSQHQHHQVSLIDEAAIEKALKLPPMEEPPRIGPPPDFSEEPETQL